MSETIERTELADPVALVTIEPKNALAVFTKEGAIEPILARVRREIDAFKGDISTSTGRKRVASFAYAVAQAKTYLEAEGKKLADEQKEIPKKIDATRRHIKATLEAWRDEVRAPLDAWEAKEDARVKGHQDAIGFIVGLGTLTGDEDLGELKARLDAAEAVGVGAECEEFAAEYAIAKDRAVNILKPAIAKREKFDADQAELARLRAKEAEREEEDRRERLRKEGEQRARDEAEADARAEAQRIENERNAERAAAAKREADLKAERDAAEQRAKDAAAKAVRDQQEKEQREAAEKAAREADTKHRGAINRAALDALVTGGLSEPMAKLAIKLIALGKVPNVSINY